VQLDPAIDRSNQAAMIGHTPLVRLQAFEPAPGVEIYAKLESRNPGGSVKDRAALSMILEGERTGAFTPDRVLLDATSGNTGLAYAMIAAARGYRVRLAVPASVTPERLRLLKVYGADVVLTDPMDGSDGAIREARRLYAESPDRYFYPDQYNNPANWRAHYEHTANEIIADTGGRITHFVAGLGTSGTFMGTGRRLKEWRPAIHLTSIQPDSPLHGLEGLKHMPTAIVPGIYDPALADDNVEVTTEDALPLTRLLASAAGIFAGPSSGAALAASVALATRIAHGAIVTIFPDGGERYISERFWTDPPPRALVTTAVVDDAIRRHGEAAYPHECCGALIGTADGVVSEALPLDNETDLEQRRRFLITPRDYQRAEEHADRTGRALVGFYHSHPDHPAEPSQFDLDHAWPNLSYPIVSVRDGHATHLRSWRLRHDRARFIEEPVVIIPRSPSWQ
jgi:S-sulfo-L-cysteine synthase (O-acetyl-L-serine-dependent)